MRDLFARSQYTFTYAARPGSGDHSNPIMRDRLGTTLSLAQSLAPLYQRVPNTLALAAVTTADYIRISASYSSNP